VGDFSTAALLFIVPTITPTEKSGWRRTTANAFERKIRLSYCFIWIIKFREVRGSTRKCGLGCPQGFEPIEMKQDMTNLVEDAHMDAHTGEKIFEDRFSPPIALS
jgi:hypothetical protein